MNNHTLLTDIAQQAGATTADIDDAIAAWGDVVVQDEDGNNWVSAEWTKYMLWDLQASALIRREGDRINAADAALVKSYEQLTEEGRRRTLPGLQGAACRQKRLLARVLGVLDCLAELVDAKAAARRINPRDAEGIRAAAVGLRRDAERNAEGALSAIRSLLGPAA
jgi:hypothetical protein